MRLRRETGDFQIKVTTGNDGLEVNSITPLLLGEDFVGQIVDVNGTFEVVTKMAENKIAGTVTAYTESVVLTYKKSDGSITAVATNP